MGTRRGGRRDRGGGRHLPRHDLGGAVAFCIVATAGLLAADLYVVLKPASARRRLLGLRTWMADHAHQAIVFGIVAIGLWLTGKSVYELAS
ncbi:hypothetical protein [Streptomyces sp. NPDC055013]